MMTTKHGISLLLVLRKLRNKKPPSPLQEMKWYDPKMAASVLKRCVTAAVKVKCLSPTFAGKFLHLTTTHL